MAKKKHDTKRRIQAKPGPKPAVLKLEGNWIDNLRTATAKKKPAGGWPK